MKAVVKEIFQDKFTKEHYQVGDVIDVADAKRIADLEERGLIEVKEEKPVTPKRSKKQ